MRKIFVLVIAFLLLASIALSGCGKKGADDAGTDAGSDTGTDIGEDGGSGDEGSDTAPSDDGDTTPSGDFDELLDEFGSSVDKTDSAYETFDDSGTGENLSADALQ